MPSIRRAQHQLAPIGGLISDGQWKRAADELGKGVWSTNKMYGYRKDLTVDHIMPEAKIDITVRPLEDSDVPVLLREGEGDDVFQIRRQHRLLAAEVPTCWVAVTDTGEPCFMQWMITSEHNDELEAGFGAEFPRLEDHQVLHEGAFTPARFRGLRIGPRAISLIGEHAPASATEAWTYVVGLDSPERPRPSSRAGFRPANVRRSQRRFGWKHVSFSELSSDDALAWADTR